MTEVPYLGRVMTSELAPFADDEYEMWLKASEKARDWNLSLYTYLVYSVMCLESKPLSKIN